MFRNIVSNELFTIILLVGLLIIAIAKLTAPKRFNDFINVIGNSKYLKIYSREQKFFDKFDALLFTNTILTLTVFSYIFYQLVYETQSISIDLLFKIAFGIALFMLIKVLTERLIASLFEIDKMIDQYLFQKISYKNYLGLVLIPINAVLLYTVPPSLNIIYSCIILLLMLNLIGLISSFKTNQSVIKHHLFYFILYLCALEIAPYVIFYKVFIA